MPLPEKFEVEILSATTLAPSVKSFVFGRVDGQPVLHDAGQWVNLTLPTEAGEIRRAYSIASPPRGAPEFEVAVTEVTGGPGSGYLCGLSAGARLFATGPQGFFTRAPDDPSPSLFVATGTGVTPLRSMIHAALAARSSAAMWLLFGVRHADDLLYRDEFERLTALHPQVRAYFTLSQGGADWEGRRGYVQTHVAELWDELSRSTRTTEASPHVYVCGLEPMVNAVRHLVRNELKVPRQQVHSERYD